MTGGREAGKWHSLLLTYPIVVSARAARGGIPFHPRQW